MVAAAFIGVVAGLGDVMSRRLIELDHLPDAEFSRLRPGLNSS
ncbi:hypothetical protein [Actinomadura sp. NTSP31]